MKVVVAKEILKANDQVAVENGERFEENGVADTRDEADRRPVPEFEGELNP